MRELRIKELDNAAKLDDELSTLRAILNASDETVKELQKWKREAVEVMNENSNCLQQLLEVAKALGFKQTAKLGEKWSIHYSYAIQYLKGYSSAQTNNKS